MNMAFFIAEHYEVVMSVVILGMIYGIMVLVKNH